jgi:hypothetical protein
MYKGWGRSLKVDSLMSLSEKLTEVMHKKNQILNMLTSSSQSNHPTALVSNSQPVNQPQP